MDALTLSPLKQKIICFCYLLLLIQASLAHDSRGRHSRIARAYEHKSKRDSQPRKSKFSDLGIFGIREHDESVAKISGTFIGMIPDAGDTGGKAQTMSEIIHSINGKRPACFGWYAQVTAGVPFDGSQLFEVMNDLKKCECVFTPAIMPRGGWDGLTYKDNRQAVRIAKVLREFTDKGIPVILRFAHEANWYQRTGEYPGNAENFKEAWDVVAKAVRFHCHDCYLHWTPNVGTMKEYMEYAPYNMDETVDLVGFDWYPTQQPSKHAFYDKAKDFYHTFAINGRKFAMAETGLHYGASYKERVDWLTQIASSKENFTELAFVNWYNSKKEWDYKIAGNGVSTTLLTAKLE